MYILRLLYRFKRGLLISLLQGTISDFMGIAELLLRNVPYTALQMLPYLYSRPSRLSWLVRRRFLSTDFLHNNLTFPQLYLQMFAFSSFLYFYIFPHPTAEKYLNLTFCPSRWVI